MKKLIGLFCMILVLGIGFSTHASPAKVDFGKDVGTSIVMDVNNDVQAVDVTVSFKINYIAVPEIRNSYELPGSYVSVSSSVIGNTVDIKSNYTQMTRAVNSYIETIITYISFENRSINLPNNRCYRKCTYSSRQAA